MREHTIEISDRKGQVLKMHIATPSALEKIISGYAGESWGSTADQTGSKHPSKIGSSLPPGHWRAIDKGLIRYNSGKIIRSFKSGYVTQKDDGFYYKRPSSGRGNVELYLVNLDGTWGMKLFDYEDWTGVNDQGEGFITQPWVLQLSEGRFSWSLVD